MAFDKKGLDNYVQVNERIVAFYKQFPEGSIQSEIVTLTETLVVVKAYAYRTDGDDKPGIGHSSMIIPGSTPYTRGSELENCETSAWGRALAALGFEVKRGIASRNEIENKQTEMTVDTATGEVIIPQTGKPVSGTGGDPLDDFQESPANGHREPEELASAAERAMLVNYCKAEGAKLEPPKTAQDSYDWLKLMMISVGVPKDAKGVPIKEKMTVAQVAQITKIIDVRMAGEAARMGVVGQ